MKKLVGYLVLICLFAGSVCGVTYGIKFAIVSNEYQAYQDKNDTSYVEELEDSISDYQIEIDELNDTIVLLKEKMYEFVDLIKELEETNADYSSQIETLESEVASYKTQVENLQYRLDELEAEVSYYSSINSTLQETVLSLENTVSLLKIENANLEETNEEYSQYISTLEGNIDDLNDQIELLTSSITSYEKQIDSLESQITNLEKTITYYEDYIAGLENDDEAVVTFIVEDAVYEIKTVTKGSTVSIDDIESTETLIFNGWTVNGTDIVDLNEYPINSNTIFTASLTRKYAVSFVSNSVEIDSQLVVENSYATAPTDPEIEGYTFKGWTVNGIDVVDVSLYVITETTIFEALFTQDTFEVNFVVDSETISIQTVAYAQTAEVVDEPTYGDYTFVGWSINGTDVVDVSNYSITSDTTFYSLFGGLQSIEYEIVYDDETSEILGYYVGELDSIDNLTVTLIFCYFVFEYEDYEIYIYPSGSSYVYNVYPLGYNGILYLNTTVLTVDEQYNVTDTVEVTFLGDALLSDTFVTAISLNYENGYITINTSCVSASGLTLTSSGSSVSDISNYAVFVV